MIKHLILTAAAVTCLSACNNDINLVAEADRFETVFKNASTLEEFTTLAQDNKLTCKQLYIPCDQRGAYCAKSYSTEDDDYMGITRQRRPGVSSFDRKSSCRTNNFGFLVSCDLIVKAVESKGKIVSISYDKFCTGP